MSTTIGFSKLFGILNAGAAMLANLCRIAMSGINGTIYPFARLASFGRVNWRPFCFNLLWALINILVFAGVLMTNQQVQSHWLEISCMGVSVCFSVLHILVLMGRILVVIEDNCVMNGLLREKHRVFPGYVIHTSGIALAVSVLAYPLFGIAALWQSEGLYPGLVAACPYVDCGKDIGDWALLFAIKGVPFAVPILDILDLGPQLELVAGLGQFAGLLLLGFNTILLYYAVVLFARQWYSLHAMFYALSTECIGEECRADIPVLQQRATRAPVSTKSRILTFAISHRNSIVRRRAISIARHAGIVSFPQTFVHNLHKEASESNKLWGLKTALQLLANEELISGYTPQRLDLLMHKIDHQVRRGRGRKHSNHVKEKLEKLRKRAVAMKTLKLPSTRCNQC